MITDPWGGIISKQEGVTEGAIYADIDLVKVYETRKSIPVRDHQKIFFDLSHLTNESKIMLKK